jgi:GNAT superfamily N-acetyltransferase
VTVRRVRSDDVPAVVDLVHELADYEKSLHEVRLTEEQLTRVLFGDSPALFGHVAEHDGEVVGMALWFLNFSTWRGTHGIYLEDLYVSPAHRGTGLGRELLRSLAAVCVERGYSRLEWSVLDWNAPSIEFYKAAGAVPMDGWTVFRLTDDALTDFAEPRSNR